MFGVFTVIHVIVLIALIGVILIQSGRGGGLAGTFGDSSASQAIFGGRGANTLLTRATAGLGAAFFITSMLLAFLSTSGGNGGSKSLIQAEAQKSGTPAATTAPAGGAPATGGAPAAGSAPAPGGTAAPAPASTPTK